MSGPEPSVPELSEAEIAAKLSEKPLRDALVGKHGAHATCVAIIGRSAAASVRTDDLGAVPVRSVPSELALRRALPEPGESLPHTVFLLGWPAHELPVDLSWRFVGNGKVFRVGKGERLRQLFGGGLVAIDPSLETSKLAKLLLAASSAGLGTSAGRVTREVAYEAWLRAAWGLGAEGSLGLDTLLAWAATHGRAEVFEAAMARPEAEGVRAELAAFLQRRLGDVAPMIWERWAAGRGPQVLEFAVLFEALVDGDGGGPLPAIRTAARHALGVGGDGFDRAWPVLGRVADSALRELERLRDGQAVRRTLAAAEALLDPADQALLGASRRLPRAWELRLAALGATLQQGAARPEADAVMRARDALRAVERHNFAQQGDQRATLEAAEMATRLLAWCVARNDPRAAVQRSPWADAEALAQWYVGEGGFVDWARRRARGVGDSPLGTGIDAVLARVDAARIEHDRRFAAGLRAWLEEGPTRDSHGSLVPIDRALERFVVPFLEGDPERRVLVLLLDGMAWAQALSVLESLDEGNDPWAPAAWNLEVAGASARLFTPVLASLPSVTSVSRSAFFAGKPMPPGKNPSASDNPRHWAEHPSLGRFLPPGEGARTLLLRGDGFTRDGSAMPETLTLVRDGSRRVVALVINAIDETLKADTQANAVWTANEVGPLRSLLDAAKQAGRAVFIAADHGHVSGQRLDWVGAKSDAGSSRWRVWRDDDAVHEYEIAVPAGAAWAPPGARGVICLADDTHSYSTASHYGEHGGATLAEVVAPAFMLACESATHGTRGTVDRALELRRLLAPPWWHLELREATKLGDAPPREPKPVGPKPSAKTRRAIELEERGQVSIVPAAHDVAPLPTPGSVEAPAAALSSATRALVDRLAKSPLLLARAEAAARRAQVLEAVAFLLERDGLAPAAVFAAHLQQPAYRAAGLVARVSEVLNVDGYEVLALDVAAKQVCLNREQLRLGFGL
jgi:hypothetical protein